MGVLVSDLSGQLSPGFIRVSVGTPEENDVFLDSYTKILEEEDSKRLFSTNHTNHAELRSNLRQSVSNWRMNWRRQRRPKGEADDK